jgi:TPR repeat protein
MGRGVPENGTEAERWLKRGLDEGYADAASILGMAYATGKAGISISFQVAGHPLSLSHQLERPLGLLFACGASPVRDNAGPMAA